MKQNETRKAAGNRSGVHGGNFSKVYDGRKQPVRGLWERNGRYYARLAIEQPNGSKKVKRVPLTTAEGKDVETAPQAQAALARLKVQRESNTLPVLNRTQTFSEFADTYLATQAAVGEADRKKPATLAKEKQMLARWREFLGGIPVSKIRPASVSSFLTDLTTKNGLSKRSAKLHLIALRNVLKMARDDSAAIQALPIPPGINDKLKSAPRKRPMFTSDELKRLCKAALATKDDGQPVTKNARQFVDYVRLLAFSGMRRNEGLALKWSDVDFAGEKLRVARQSGAKGNDLELKNRTPREIDFNPALADHLADMHARRAPDSQWVFPSPQRGEKDIHAQTFRESLELARAHAGLRPVGFHDLRHHFASFAVMSGVDFMTIARWLGHKDGGILIGKVYGHLAEEHTKAAAKRVSFGAHTGNVIDIREAREAAGA